VDTFLAVSLIRLRHLHPHTAATLHTHNPPFSISLTPQTLLACICDLWHKLHVPLSYRSRFFLQFRCKELIYLQMEQCRLKHRLEQLEKETDYLGRSKQMEKASRALEVSTDVQWLRS
jgi:hypothetical protein